jgi:membrane protein required for colicin V production
MPVNIIDILIILPLGLSMFFGAKSGSVKLMIGIIFFIISIWLTYLIFPAFGEMLARHMENEFMINILAIMFAYIVSSVFCSLIGKTLKKIAGDSSGGFIDTFLGLILGTVRGAIISLILFLIITIIAGKTYKEAENLYDLVPKKEDEQTDIVKDSYSYEKILGIIEMIIDEAGEDYLKDRKVPDFIK